MTLQGRRREQKRRGMARFVEVGTRKNTPLNQKALHSLDPHSGRANVTAGAAEIPALGGEAIVGGKCHNTRAKKFGDLFGGFV